jgi:hypothetical protein
MRPPRPRPLRLTTGLAPCDGGRIFGSIFFMIRPAVEDLYQVSLRRGAKNSRHFENPSEPKTFFTFLPLWRHAAYLCVTLPLS